MKAELLFKLAIAYITLLAGVFVTLYLMAAFVSLQYDPIFAVLGTLTGVVTAIFSKALVRATPWALQELGLLRSRT